MTNYSEVILWLSIGYALIGVLLLAALVFARLAWPIKAGLIVLTSAFYIMNFFATRALLGWSSPDPLPPSFKLIAARIVEPLTLAGDPGSIYLWVEALDEDNLPSGTPRAYRLPYEAHLADRAQVAIRASAEGQPQGGRTADFGAGNGGEAPLIAREVTPSSITTTGGGDPSTGGGADPASLHGDKQTIVFAPLAPPRLPPKDAQ